MPALAAGQGGLLQRHHLGALIPSTVGKIELESLSDEVPEERIVDRLIARSIHEVFGRRVDIDSLAEVIEAFESGLVIRTGEAVPSRDYVSWMRETPGMIIDLRGNPGGSVHIVNRLLSEFFAGPTDLGRTTTRTLRFTLTRPWCRPPWCLPTA